LFFGKNQQGAQIFRTMAMLLEPVRLQGGLQKGGCLYMTLGYPVREVVKKIGISGLIEVETKKVDW
jgi:hypothetical protein